MSSHLWEYLFLRPIKNRKKDNLMLKFNYYNNELFKDKKESISNLKILLEYYKYFLDNNESLDLSLNELISIISIMTILETLVLMLDRSV